MKPAIFLRPIGVWCYLMTRDGLLDRFDELYKFKGNYNENSRDFTLSQPSE